MAGFPPLEHLLQAANVRNPALLSTACDHGIVDTNVAGYLRSAGAIMHVAFREDELNRRPELLLGLGEKIAESILWDAHPALRLQLTVEPYKNWKGHLNAYFGLAIEFAGLGDDDAAALAESGHLASCVADAIALVNVGSLIETSNKN